MQALRRRIFSVVALGVVGAATPAVHAGPKADQHAASDAKGANKTDLTDAQILGVADTANTGEVAQGNIALAKAHVSVEAKVILALRQFPATLSPVPSRFRVSSASLS